MISVLTDLIQSAAIVFLTAMVITVARRFNRIDRRSGEQRIIYQQLPESQDPQPVCGCKHHQCFHDENGCGKTDTWASYGTTDTAWQPCGCKRYTGPEPLPTVIP